MLTNDQSSKSSHPTLPDSSSAISSRASAGGPTPSNWQGGQTMFQFGVEAAHANRFRAPASERAKWTNDTCGPTSTASSRSAALQRSLESRLRAATDLNGSMEYRLTWRKSDMPSGRLICRLRASARLIGVRDCSGWPTPNAGPQNDNDSTWENRREKIKAEKKNGNGFGLTLGMAVQLASARPTPNTMDHLPSSNLEQRKTRGGCKNLKDVVTQLAGWVSPTVMDANRGVNPPRAWDTGIPLSQQVAGMEQSGECRLNPHFSRWLMGYPLGWCESAVTAMLSCRKSPRSSSKRT